MVIKMAEKKQGLGVTYLKYAVPLTILNILLAKFVFS